MPNEPCIDSISAYALDNRQRGQGLSFQPHSWNSWHVIKEEACFSKDGFQTLLQERECAICGVLQQRRVHF